MILVNGTMSNVFVVGKQQLLTPSLGHAGVAGVMRRVVKMLPAREGIVTEVRPVHQREIVEADELFLTNTLIGIWPVARLEQKAFGADNPITRMLMSRLVQCRSY